ncbi:hypothetical protein IW144_002477 [Coemansia sp. RSA 522]|nr:hypothetical protein IW144_002477 [Coemansia sp. RSA 522]
MLFTKAKTAIKTTARRIFKRAANSNRNADNSGSVTTTAIKAVAKRIFQRSNINSSCASDNSRDNGSSLNSACIDGTSTSDIGDSNRCDNTDTSSLNHACIDGTSTSDIGDSNRRDNTDTSSLNSACIDGTSTSDRSTNCTSDRSSASNTAVSASIRTNSNSGSTAIDSNNCDSHDRISKAVAALYEACAARFEPKPIFAPKWAFERAPAHQPRRCFKGSPQLTMSLGELMEARKIEAPRASSKDRLSVNNEAHELFVEPKLTIAPGWAIEQASTHQLHRCFKGSPRPTMSLRELMEARKKGLLQASSKDWLLANNEAHKLFVELIVEAQTPIPC